MQRRCVKAGDEGDKDEEDEDDKDEDDADRDTDDSSVWNNAGQGSVDSECVSHVCSP